MTTTLIFRRISWWVPSTALIYIVLLFALHVQAENQTTTSSYSTTGLTLGGLTLWDWILFGAVVLLGFELMSYIALHTGPWFHFAKIPVRGKHLDELSPTDITFIALNKLTAVPFVYCFLRYSYYSPHVAWYPRDMTLLNTLVAMPLLYLVYDFFYTLFHWALHIKAIYAYIHKHHHMQKAPSRGNTDAINVHPFEYICGEFNHLFALYLVSTHICEVHVATSMVFLAVGGYLAGLNHTRDDIVWLAYDSKAHDVHHRIPQSNYGQYCMVWDRLFGTFRPYNPKDRVNPKAQLNPATGKSYEYEEAKKMT